MRNFFFYLLLFTALCSCQDVESNRYMSFVSSSVDASSVDLDRAIRAAYLSGEDLILPKGEYEMTSSIVLDRMSKNLVIDGQGSTIKTSGGRLFNFISDYQVYNFTGQASRGDRQVDFEGQGLISITSEEIIDSSWNTKASDLHYLKGNTLSEPLNFNYDTASITVYTPVKVTLKNLTIIVDSTYKTLGGHPVLFQGMAVELENIKVVGNVTTDLLALTDCHTVSAKNLVLDQGRYGLLLNRCRKVEVDGILGTRLIHPVTPASWTDDVHIKDMVSALCSGGMDSHPSFNVTYENCNFQDVHLSNCRAFGVRILDCSIRNIQSHPQPYTYHGLPGTKFIHDDYDFLFGEYDIEIRNTEFVKHDLLTDFNGISIYWARNVILDNVKAHAVAIHGGSAGDTKCNVWIRDSHIGKLRARGANLKLRADRINFDQELYPDADFAIRVPAGRRSFRDCTIKGYPYLLDYIESPSLDVYSFLNCDIDVDELCKTIQYPSLDYAIKFIGGHVKGYRNPEFLAKGQFIAVN